MWPFLPYLRPVHWSEQVPQSMPAWHWDAPQCCPEFYSYNLTSNVRASHTERQLNPCLPKWIINCSGKKNTLFSSEELLPAILFTKRLLLIVFTRVRVMNPKNALCKDLHPSFVVLSGWCLQLYRAGWKTGRCCAIGIMWQTCISADKQLTIKERRDREEKRSQ